MWQGNVLYAKREESDEHVKINLTLFSGITDVLLLRFKHFGFFGPWTKNLCLLRLSVELQYLLIFHNYDEITERSC